MLDLASMKSAELTGAVVAYGGDPKILKTDDEKRGYLTAKMAATAAPAPSGVKVDFDKLTPWLNVAAAVAVIVMAGIPGMAIPAGVIALVVIGYDMIRAWRRIAPKTWSNFRKVYLRETADEICAVVAIGLVMAGFPPIGLSVALVALAVGAVNEF